MTTGSVVIHRDELVLASLPIDGSTIFTAHGSCTMKVDDEGILDATPTYDVDEVSSPFVEGSQVTNAIRGMVEQTIKIQVRAESHLELQEGIGLLLAAAQQSSFIVDLILDGVFWSWSSRRKGYSMSFNRQTVFTRIAVVPIVFDRYPTALSGPY